MDEDEDVKRIPCLVRQQNNYKAEVLVFAHAVVPQLQHIYVASLSPNTHLAEKMLSTDFCDWSDVTDGLLWETWRQRGRVRQGKERENEAVAFSVTYLFSSQHESHIIKK